VDSGKTSKSTSFDGGSILAGSANTGGKSATATASERTIRRFMVACIGIEHLKLCGERSEVKEIHYFFFVVE
jgi:hypothetical protein